MQAKNPAPIKRPEEIAYHPDASIDQDFKGFPFANATEKLITPETEKEKVAAGIQDEEVKKTSGG